MTASAGEGDEQQWREWELELVEGASASPDLLDRLANRLLDAGAVPAGHGSKLARVLARRRRRATKPEAEPTSADPIHRAVAEQVDQLVEWDRAVRADVYDSVHQMRVTTRKIRSLLQASEGAFGISNDAWVLDELRQLASVLGVARDAEVLAERYERALDELPDDLVRGPIRKRLVDGAKRRYRSGLRRSLIAMRSERYFRLLDALEGLVAAEPPSTAPAKSRRPSPSTRPTSECARPPRARPVRPTRTATRHCIEFARAPSDFATPRPRPVKTRCPIGPRASRPCWATIRTASSAART